MLKLYAPPESPLFELHDWYVREMDKEGQPTLGKIPWSYGTYADGTAIPRLHRHVYRTRPDLIAAFPDPFAVHSPSLREAITREYPSDEALRAGNASEQTLFAVAQLRNTLAWRIGHAITSPVERALSLVPGLVPRVKNALGA